MDRFKSETLEASDGAEEAADTGHSLVDDVREELRRFAERRKEALAARVDEVAAECVRGAQNLERVQPATAAVLRRIGVRLGGLAESLEEYSPSDVARYIGRGLGDNPLLFAGGIVAGIIVGSSVFGARRRLHS